MKILRKTAALMLVLALTLAIASCNGAETKTNASDTLRIFGDIGSSEGYSVLDERILAGFKEKTGITVELQQAASSGYMEQLQLMIASGEYPDAALFPSTTVQAYIDVCEAGKVVALDEYLTEENCPNLMKYTYDTAWEGVKPLEDGKIYAIPRTSLTRNEGIALRADWLRNVGMGDILDRQFHEVSTDDFMEIAKRFTLDDPDNNGKNDTIATACWTDDTTKQYGPHEFARGFYGDYGWYAYEGEDYTYMFPQYSQKSDIFKKQMQYTQDLHAAGYIDADGPTMNKNAVKDNFCAQRYGIVPDFVGSILGRENDIINANNGISCPDGSYVDYIFASDEAGRVAGNGYYKPMWGQWCVFNACADPNNFVQLCDYILSDEIWDLVANGEEGTTYEVVDGFRVNIDPGPNEQTLATTFPGSMVRRAGDRDFFVKVNTVDARRAHMVDIANYGFYIGQATQIDSLDNGFVPIAATETRFINAQDKLAKTISAICANQMEVSEYDKALESWYKEGGKEYVEQMNAYIKENQKLESAPKVDIPLTPDQWDDALKAAQEAVQ